MSGVTTERPHSRLILVAIATFCLGMLAAGIALVLLNLGVSPLRSWLSFAVIVGHFAVSIGLYMRSRRAHGEGWGWREWLIFSVPPLLLLRGIAIAENGPGVDFAEHGPLTGSFLMLVDLPTIVMAALLVGIWHVGGLLAHNIDALHPQSSEIPPSANSPEYYAWMTSSSRWIDRGSAVSAIASAGVVGGVVLTGLAVLTAGPPIGSGVSEVVPPIAPLVLLVLYFVGLLILHSYASLVRQTSTWSLQLAQQAKGITENWIRSSLLLLGVTLLIAMLLPRFRLPETAGLFALVFQIGFIFWQLLLLPVIGIVFLLAKLFLLLGLGDGVSASPAPPVEQPQTQQFDDRFLQILQSLGLWAVLGFTAYLIYRRVTSSRPQWRLGPLLRRARAGLILALKLLLASLSSLLHWSAEAAKAAGAEVAGRILGIVGVTRVELGKAMVDRGARSNREQIWRIYLQMLADAEKAGLKRLPNQTPTEFERVCGGHPGVQAESLRRLTEVFLLARYVNVDIDDGLVASARAECRFMAAALEGRR